MITAEFVSWLEQRVLPPSAANASPARSVRRVASKYGAELREYPGRGHWLHEEAGFEMIAAEIVSWLEQRVLQPSAANASPA